MPKRKRSTKRKSRAKSKRTKKPQRRNSRRRLLKESRTMSKVRTTAHGRRQDRKIKAIRPGRRISNTGRPYTERRTNRSDKRSRHY